MARTPPALWPALFNPFGNGFVHMEHLAGNDMQRSRIQLTDDEIKAWPTNVVQLIPAPPTNYLALPLFCLLQCHSLAAYGNFGDGAGIGVYCDLPGSTGDWFELIGWDPGIGVGVLSDLLNAGKALILARKQPSFQGWDPPTYWNLLPAYHTADNYPVFLDGSWWAYFYSAATGDLTGGDPGNILTIDTFYELVPTP